MPKVATFLAIHDGNVEFPTAGGQDHFQFALPGLSGSATLFLRMQVSGRSTFQVRLNQEVSRFQVNTSFTRSFHEIYQFSSLRAEANEVTISVTRDEDRLATVTVSDLVIFYQVTI